MVIVVTGASSGFGLAISRCLVKRGYQVIGCARRLAKLKQLQSELGTANFYPLAFDIQNHLEVKQALASLPTDWQKINVLVNNAGLALGLEPAHKADFTDWQHMIATNITGTAYLTHLILPSMVANNTGLIINIGSIAGNYPYPGGNVYGATKAFIKQFSLNLRADLAGTKIKVTNLEPGLCGGTEFSQVRFHGDAAKAAQLYKDIDYIQPEDIANTVLWLVQLPEHVNVNRLEIMPVAQTFNALLVTKKAT